MRSRLVCAGSCSRTLPSTLQRNATCGCASARRRSAASQWPVSVDAVLRNLRRAGVLKNKSRTSTVVPDARAAGVTDDSVPPSDSICHACAASTVALHKRTRATDATEASASPRKPRLATPSRSSRLPILLVA